MKRVRGFEAFLAKHYLGGHRHAMGGGLSSLIAIGGMAVGVAALLVTLAVMTGFRQDIERKILGAQPQVLVMGMDGNLPQRPWGKLLATVKPVQAWTPFVMGQALLKNRSRTQGVIVKGIHLEKEKVVTHLHQRTDPQSWARFENPKGEENPPALLGRELAKTLNVSPGDNILMALPAKGLNPFGDIPPVFPLTVVGTLRTGLYDYDSSLTLVSLKAAQVAFGLGEGHTGLGIRLQPRADASEAAMDIQKTIGAGALARSWLDLNSNLFAALKLEKIVMFVILTLITLVASFTIISNLLLITAQKVREIGILRAMGASRKSIEKIFLLKGLLMGAIGIFLGVLLGGIIGWVLKKFQFVQLPADVYYVDTLPVQFVLGDVVLVVGAAFVIVLLASYYPARKAAGFDTLSALRHT